MNTFRRLLGLGDKKPAVNGGGDTTPIPPKRTSASLNTCVSASSSTIVKPPAPPTNTKQHGAAQYTEEQLNAIRKIQKQVRKKTAIEKAISDNNWQIFANLDVRDEMEMIHLASFFQTLLDNVPGLDQYEVKIIPDETESERESARESAAARGRTESRSSTIHGNNDHTNYDIGKEPLTSQVAEDLLNVYRKPDGKVNGKLVMKILRHIYKYYKDYPNTNSVEVSKGCKVTVVGDLHGQLDDLIHIFDENGLPSDQNKYVFNGDFVDRGNKSVEIMLILFAFAAAQPTNLFLNRGNHEDASINRVYGFQNECQEKYDELTYFMFCEVFRYLPLFSLISKNVFVVHGGLFHDPDVLLPVLNSIQRIDYVVKPAVPYPECTVGLDNEGVTREYLNQLQRDALWSDPTKELGFAANPRGAGVMFGPDITQKFMRNNGLDMIIRSHECVRLGFDLPYNHQEGATKPADGVPLLCTLFSASNYNANAQNDGAYLVLQALATGNSHQVGKSNLYYKVNRYKINKGGIAEATDLATSNNNSILAVITKKKIALKNAFEEADTENTGTVSRIDWSLIMQKVTGVRIRWLSIIASLVPFECLTPSSVNYKLFIESLNINKPEAGYSIFQSNDEQGNEQVMDAMYVQRRKLEHIFEYFDVDGNGTISRDEFRAGCQKLNNSITDAKHKLTDIDRTLDLMDFDGSNSIDINEFFETFRILDAADGKVDGVLSLAK